MKTHKLLTLALSILVASSLLIVAQQSSTDVAIMEKADIEGNNYIVYWRFVSQAYADTLTRVDVTNINIGRPAIVGTEKAQRFNVLPVKMARTAKGVECTIVVKEGTNAYVNTVSFPIDP